MPRAINKRTNHRRQSLGSTRRPAVASPDTSQHRPEDLQRLPVIAAVVLAAAAWERWVGTWCRIEIRRERRGKRECAHGEGATRRGRGETKGHF
jgi:hypothetical protein